MIEFLQKISMGDLSLQFYKQNNTITFTMIPTSMENLLPCHRTGLPETDATKAFLQRFSLEPDTLESMVQLKLNTDRCFPQMFPGRSMRNSGSVSDLKFLDQTRSDSKIIIRFQHPEGLLAEQIIEIFPGKNYLKTYTRLIHNGDHEVTVEYLAGCSLGMLSPFQPDDGPGKYYIHRFQSAWAAEGRPLAQSIEESNLEMSWQAAGLRNIRFGVNGSMPIRGFFPFLAFEDRQAGVFWGIQAEAPASWELEISRTGDFLNLSGGEPGRESNGWTKVLKPGETFESMKMIISCVHGTLDNLCRRMTEYQKNTIFPKENMSVLFNEYCTTWGKPWKRNIEQLLEPVKQSGAKYFIMDAGWFRNNTVENHGSVGDWDPKEEMYPDGGFAGMVERIRSKGLIPGIWFELEICEEKAKTAKQHPDWFLTLDGVPFRHGPRLFLDFRKPEVIAHLREKVCAFLKKNNIGYMKVDYNGSTAGLCDGPETPAENHRKYMECVLQFFAEIKQTFPNLILEICASGGHRLTPKWSEVADMFSFSDAHEGVEVPLVAANVQRMVPAYKSQIWATLRPWNDENRLYYLLCGGFLGRLCLSGDIDKLSAEQMGIVQRATALYQATSGIIAKGQSTVEQHWNNSFNHPEGWQKVCFKYGRKKLTVIHVFGNPPEFLSFAIRDPHAQMFAPKNVDGKIQNEMFHWNHPEAFSALLLMEKKKNL